jgi:UPF0755 protein
MISKNHLGLLLLSFKLLVLCPANQMTASKNRSKWLYSLVLLLVIVGFFAWGSWAWWRRASAPPSETGKTVKIHIPSGTATQQIGQKLEDAGLIRSVRGWRVWAFWMGFKDQEGGFKAGTYKLSSTQPLPAVAEKIWEGETVEVSFTIPEGWSIERMAAHFESKGYFPAQEFIAATKDIPREQYPWLPADLPHLEGFLYPETYQVSGDHLTPQRVIQIMLERFEQVALPTYQQHQDQTQLTLLEWVTLASIVEKEAVVSKERPLIAGVFMNRLDQGMRLQADPTVEYGLGIKQTTEEALTLAEVNTPSPYNTYLNAGLPPTPIASPGKSSLKAVVNPENTEHLYFVARYDGTHVFSKTLEAHKAARRSIQQQ